MSSSTSRTSSKRARGANNGGNQPACCLVDGCNSDLSNCRDYYRTHKVCEIHSKTPQVSICGLKQRFCQQCSRSSIVSIYKHSSFPIDQREQPRLVLRRSQPEPTTKFPRKTEHFHGKIKRQQQQQQLQSGGATTSVLPRRRRQRVAPPWCSH